MNYDCKIQKKNAILFFFISICLAILIFLLANAIQILEYAKIDEKQEADTAIVLGAGVWKDMPSPVFRERIRHGIWLYQNGYVDTLILTGGYSSGNSESDAQIAKNYSISQGVPATDILIEEDSSITQENFYYAKRIMEELHLKNALIVSDPLHMKRAMLMAEDMGIESYSSPTPTSRYKSLKSKLPFFLRELFFYTGYKVYRSIR